VLPIGLLGELISTGTLLAFAAVCAAVARLRLADPARPRPFRAPLWQLTAPLGVLSALGLLASMGWFAVERILIWQAVGVVLILLMRHRLR
jgi:APA family basic amino acid/polyamine antiporter